MVWLFFNYQIRPNEIYGWVCYLQDTRNEMYAEFIYPVQDILDDKNLGTEEKLKQIKEIDKKFAILRNKWNVQDYGLFVDSQ